MNRGWHIQLPGDLYNLTKRVLVAVSVGLTPTATDKRKA